LVQDDIKAFGGVDFVHIFDWSIDPQHGRVGQYDPWDYLGGEEGLRSQIHKLKMDNIPVGLYLEGYLLDKRSDIAKSFGQKWTVFTKEGVPCTRMGAGYWYPCPDINQWQEYLANACLSVCKKINPEGIYIDQYGYGTQLICHNTEHSHPIPSNQQKCENQMMIKLRQKLPSTSVLYTEYIPTDVSTQYQDGSFTYANGPINLTRFALPDFKLFVILRCDVPMGNDFEGIKRVFFNGEGIWLEGPLSRKKWFPLEIRKLISKTYHILHANRDAFTCMNPIPLVPTEDSRILANQFYDKDKVVWTLYNPHNEPVEKELLKVKHFSGATYVNVWDGRQIVPRILEDTALLAFRIGANDVSCIIQYRK
jgi:hypothetical protein